MRVGGFGVFVWVTVKGVDAVVFMEVRCAILGLERGFRRLLRLWDAVVG